jgi:Family of unknown function (DUF5906)/NrS-1  polymerase HBD domain
MGATLIPDALPPAYAPLGIYRQWLPWKSMPDVDPMKKPRKVPVDQYGRPCNPHDARNHHDFDTARILAIALGATGLGFVLTDRDPIFCADIDHALVNGVWNETARAAFAAFPGALFELSFSGDGFHLFGISHAQPDCGVENEAAGLAIYRTLRFIAVTFEQHQGAVLDQSSNDLVFSPVWIPPTQRFEPVELIDAYDPGWSGPEDDEALIAKFLAAAPGPNGLPNAKLWAGQWEGYYPSQSEADQALATKLAFWAGKNPLRMNRLFERSQLYRPEKWGARPDYALSTITRAVNTTTNVYNDGKGAVGPTVELAPGTPAAYAYLDPQQQLEFFSTCTYVIDRDEVFDKRDGVFLNRGRFRARYSHFVFAIDGENDKTTEDAWKAFTESRVNPVRIAHSVTFRPPEPAGTVYEEEGRTLVNTYVPAVVERVRGDASPFLDLLGRVIHDAHDRDIYLSYAAHAVQNPGSKAGWAIVVQGVPGNGKSLLAEIIARAIGLRFVHVPNPADIENKFNQWLEGTLLVIVNDADREATQRDLSEILKPLITDRRIEIQGKGVNQYTGDNRANVLINTNHRDAVRKTREDRRFAVIYTNQQKVEDLARDGLTEDYFARFVAWLESGGFAICAEFLHSYSIPDALNPSVGALRAPLTSSTDAAIRESMTRAEQILAEAIAAGRLGLRGGWVSFKAAADVLERETRSTKKVRQTIEALGYVPHPHLPDGRSTRPTAVDGNTKPRIFCVDGGLRCNIEDPARVIAAYEKAQGIRIAQPAQPGGGNRGA